VNHLTTLVIKSTFWTTWRDLCVPHKYKGEKLDFMPACRVCRRAGNDEPGCSTAGIGIRPTAGRQDYIATSAN
jgi:hypothetical protein